jgi:hypothetical protein
MPERHLMNTWISATATTLTLLTAHAYTDSSVV